MCFSLWHTANVSSLPCLKSHDTRQRVSHRQPLSPAFFFAESRVLHMANSLRCARQKTHVKKTFCRRLVAVCYTRQSVCRVQTGLCRVHLAHSKGPVSRSAGCAPWIVYLTIALLSRSVRMRSYWHVSDVQHPNATVLRLATDSLRDMDECLGYQTTSCLHPV